jgi:hypothetical protein
MMHFPDSSSEEDSEELPHIPPRRHEFAVEILKLLTPALGLVLFIAGLSSKYPWLSTPWVRNALIFLGVLVLIWFAKPRLTVWLRRHQGRKREQRFIAETDVRLRQLVEQFAVFASLNDNRSLISILRSVHSQNMQVVDQIITGDHVNSWLFCYREQLAFPTSSYRQFLAQCRQFSHILQEFNRNYVLRAQKELAAKPPLPEHAIAQLEQFREEYTAFRRSAESWGTAISDYLQSGGAMDHSTLWRLAPTTWYERAKPFARSKSDGA